MKLIIDGYNLMYKLKPNDPTLEKKRERLILLLSEFKKINNVDLILVFDGKFQESGHRGYETRAGIKIIFSAKEETADDVIIDILRKRKEKPKNYAVVSSDNKIKDFAYENNIHIILSEDFLEYLT